MASSSKTLPPRSAKCFANVFLLIFMAPVRCSKGTRGTRMNQGVASPWRNPAQFPPGSPDWLLPATPGLEPALHHFLLPNKRSLREWETQFFFNMPSMCSVLKNISKWLLCLWKVIIGWGFPYLEKKIYSHHSACFLCIHDTMDNGRHWRSMSSLGEGVGAEDEKKERKIFRNPKEIFPWF